MQQLLTLLDDRVIPGFDAASAALYIMTADEMPKEVFVEDTIEWIVKLVKWHLFDIVYPYFSMLKGLFFKAICRMVSMRGQSQLLPSIHSNLPLQQLLTEQVYSVGRRFSHRQHWL